MGFENKLISYTYSHKDDYDKNMKISGHDIAVYSKKCLEGENALPIVAEAYEKDRLNKEKVNGRVDFPRTHLYTTPPKSHFKFLYKGEGYVAVHEGGVVEVLKFNILPIILAALILIAVVGGGITIASVIGNHSSSQGGDIDPNIKPVSGEALTISGTVTKDGLPLVGAHVSLQSGNTEVSAATTNEGGTYLLADVTNGYYNLVCSYGSSILTKLAGIKGEAANIDFTFPADDLHDVGDITQFKKIAFLPESKGTDKSSDIRARVAVDDATTPAIAVGGIDVEGMINMQVGKTVDFSFNANALSEEAAPSADRDAIKAISGELNLSFFTFNVKKEVFDGNSHESSENIEETQTVFEIALPYDSSSVVGTYVFRCHNGEALRFEELRDKPTVNFRDGTYYFDADTVFIYTNKFSTYAVGSASAGRVTRGTDSITYNNRATVNLSTNEISMFYKHDYDSSHNAKIQLYLVGENSNLLISESGMIPPGNMLEIMSLNNGVKNMPSVGTYSGILKIIYIGDDGNQIDTNVDIPLSVTITQ